MKNLCFILLLTFLKVNAVVAQQATAVWTVKPEEKGANLTCPNTKIR